MGLQPSEVQPSLSHGARQRHSVHAHVPRAAPPHLAWLGLGLGLGLGARVGFGLG